MRRGTNPTSKRTVPARRRRANLSRQRRWLLSRWGRSVFASLLGVISANLRQVDRDLVRVARAERHLCPVAVSPCRSTAAAARPGEPRALLRPGAAGRLAQAARGGDQAVRGTAPEVREPRRAPGSTSTAATTTDDPMRTLVEPVSRLPRGRLDGRMTLGAVAAWLDALLDAPKFRTEEPENGLIVDAGRPVRRIGAAVNTSFAASRPHRRRRRSVARHHTPAAVHRPPTAREKLARLKLLGISLYCAHASLDGAPDIGTGDSLARLLRAQGHGSASPSTRARPPASTGGGRIPGRRWLRPTPNRRGPGAPQPGGCDRVGIVTGAAGSHPRGWRRHAPLAATRTSPAKGACIRGSTHARCTSTW